MPSRLAIQAEAMLEWARTARGRVELFTGPINPKSMLAALVFRRSHVNMKDVYRQDLDDDAFARLTRCVGQINRSGLTLVEGDPPNGLRSGAFLGGPLFAVMTL